ncbi:neutral zinc metallopeptidase [Leptodesmis sp.]|uniref:neutral zinc metallopeptidase n=1 Tax=Leptodesmis sp. TaxID=3100501 RepID=UPI0040535767
MKWEFGRRSSNVEDRRGMPAGPVVGGGIGVILLAIVVTLLGGDPSAILNQAPQRPVTARPPRLLLHLPMTGWPTLFQWYWRIPKIPEVLCFGKWAVLTGIQSSYYSLDPPQSACGYAKPAMEPFCCPLDQKVYVDLSFYQV